MMAHQSFDTTAAHPTALSLQLGMDARAAIASASIAMDLLDVVNEVAISGGSPAVCTENLNPNVLTMKSAQYGARIYDAGSLNLARDRRILVQ